jgi:hypothetical protein
MRLLAGVPWMENRISHLIASSTAIQEFLPLWPTIAGGDSRLRQEALVPGCLRGFSLAAVGPPVDHMTSLEAPSQGQNAADGFVENASNDENTGLESLLSVRHGWLANWEYLVLSQVLG